MFLPKHILLVFINPIALRMAKTPCLEETILMIIQNICFRGKIRKKLTPFPCHSSLLSAVSNLKTSKKQWSPNVG